MNFLDFEQPIAELEAKIEELRFVENNQDTSVSKEILALKKRSQNLTESIFSDRIASWRMGYSVLIRLPENINLKSYFVLIQDFVMFFLKEYPNGILSL